MHRRTFLAATTASAAVAALPATVRAQPANPLLAPWTGPFGGVPPFDKARVADFAPAIEAAMAEEIREIDSIAGNPAPPTFENTIAALETTGLAGNRAGTIYGVWSGTLSTPEVRAVDRSLQPKIAAHNDRIIQNAALFRRIDAVYQARETAKLTPEQKRLTVIRWNAFVRGGAQLGPAAKTRLAEINGELAGAYTTFSQNLLIDETNYVLYLTEADLSGLPADVRAAAAAAAAERKHPGEFAILNTAENNRDEAGQVDDPADDLLISIHRPLFGSPF